MLNYTNIPVIIDGNTYLATQSNFSVSTSLEPVYALGNAGKVTQDPTGPIKGTLSLDYNIDQDGIKDLFDSVTSDLSANIPPITVSLGGQSFAKAYLTTHGANGQANQLATAKAGFDLYFASTSQAIAFGSSGSGGSAGGSTPLAHGAASSVSTVGGITDAVSFSYESTIQYDYVFKMGTVTPAAVYIARASKKMTIEGYSISSNISMCGQDASVTATVNSLCAPGAITTYSTDGQIISLDGSVSAGQVGRGKITVTQFI